MQKTSYLLSNLITYLTSLPVSVTTVVRAARMYQPAAQVWYSRVFFFIFMCNHIPHSKWGFVTKKLVDCKAEKSSWCTYDDVGVGNKTEFFFIFTTKSGQEDIFC